MTTDTEEDRASRPSRAILCQLSCATLPMFLVLCYFLYIAHERPKDPYYSDDMVIDDDVVRAQLEEPKFSLYEILWVFMSLLWLWMSLLLYIKFYIKKRRELIRLYADAGETVKGDVLFDEDAGCCDYKPSWCFWNYSACCGLYAKDYSDIRYTVEGFDNEGETGGDLRGTVTKVVRTYKPWFREKVDILVLPGLPRSGLPKSDVETDIKSQARNRIGGIFYIIFFWIVFLILGGAYICFQIGKTHDELYHSKQAWTFFCTMVLLAGPVMGYFNYLRFLKYRTWATDSGTVQIDASSSSSSSLRLSRKSRSGSRKRSSSRRRRKGDVEDPPEGYRELT